MPTPRSQQRPSTGGLHVTWPQQTSAKHLFETERLGAKLHQIAIIRLALATLVLHRVWLGEELYYVSAPGEAQPLGAQPNPSHRPHSGATALSGQIGAFMQETALSGASVLHPNLLQVDQCPLSGTKCEVLQPA